MQKCFITLPGVIDIAISGYYLYADSYVDLVVLNIQDLDNITEAGRLKDIIPYTTPATKTDYPTGTVDKDRGVVLTWELRTLKEKINNEKIYYPVYDLMSTLNLTGGTKVMDSGVSSGGVGIGGSMARFGLNGDVLYVVDRGSLKVLSIANKISPTKVREIYPSWNVETMFLSGKKMFLGTTTGMAIYDITNASFPTSLTFFNHARSCDPVIVDDTLAYVTLRSGTTCGGIVNCLDVINVKDFTKPVLVKSYPMVNPNGLGKNGDILFICDGSAGLKVYDAADPRNISDRLIYSYPDIRSYDAIPIGSLLVMIGDDGLYQYNYSNIKNITLLSSIPVVK